MRLKIYKIFFTILIILAIVVIALIAIKYGKSMQNENENSKAVEAFSRAIEVRRK